MSYPFPSSEWTSQLCIELNNSRTYADAAKKWEGDVIVVIEGQAGIYLDLWHGKCRNAQYLADPDSQEAEFKISASMDKWISVLEGDLDPIQGMMKRQLKLDGNLIKIMQNIKAAQEMVNCAIGIDSEFV